MCTTYNLLFSITTSKVLSYSYNPVTVIHQLKFIKKLYYKPLLNC